MDRDGFAGRRFAPARNVRRSAGMLAALLAVIATPTAAGTPQLSNPISYATPALWKISDSDTTIYLFGTFHTLDRNTVWFNSAVRDAFDRSGELVLETVVPKEAAEIQSEARRVTIGADGKPKPYFESTKAVLNRSRGMGLSVDDGADQVLRRLADERGKPVAGLEGFAEQLAQLARIKTGAAPSNTKVVATSVADLLAAWKSGDSAAFAAMLAGFEAKSPDAYRILIADRNSRWASWLAARLDHPGVVFVAVGSGHLAGKDSVQQRLSERGIATARIG